MRKNFNIVYTFLTLFAMFGLMFYLILPNRAFSKSEFFTQNPELKLSSKSDNSFVNNPVYFEENQGQFDKRVKYFARGTSGYSLFLTGTEAVYVLRSPNKEREKGRKGEREIYSFREGQRTKDKGQKATAIFMKLVGANKNSVSKGLEEMLHKTNYFKGKQSNWRTEIPNFRQVRMENVYQGINAVWKGKENGSLQYDFVVEPNANPMNIEWEIEGAKDVSINEQGDLLIETEYGTIQQQKPFTYQENTEGFRHEIESGFVVKSKNKIGFEIGNYDRTKTLTIDPSVNLTNLAFSTFLGGSSVEEGDDIAVDRAGNVYVTGYTDSPSFPTTAGTFDTSLNGGEDVFVTKLNAGGTAFVYSTFLGGNADERGSGIAVDDLGNAYVSGQTFDGTTDYPTTVGVFDVTHNGNFDLFITKLNPTGSALIYSTFIGGNLNDLSGKIAVDTNGNAYIAGSSASANYPTTVGAYDTTISGTFDAVLTKLSADGSSLIYSTFIGGSSIDQANGIALDSAGNAFITGYTSNAATSFPTTPTAFDTVQNGLDDVFVTRFNAGGSALLYSTLIGGSGNDQAFGIDIDSGNNAYITGRTDDAATDFPTTVGAFDRTHNGLSDVFITKIDTRGENLLYSTYLGGNDLDFGYDIKVDDIGNVFIAGFTNNSSINLPVTANAFDATLNGSNDAFVTKINQSGSFLLYSTYIGGGATDVVYGLDIDSSGNVYITGETFSSFSFPTTPNVVQTSPDAGGEIFVSKLGDFSIAGRTVDFAGLPISNTRIALSGASSGFVLSDAEGFFNFSDTAAGNFAVSATKSLYQFNPGTFQFPNLQTNQNLTFVGQPVTGGPTAAMADLGGNVQSSVGNVGLPNTKLVLIDAASGNSSVVYSDSKGDYEFQGLLTGNFYLVVPEKEGYNFNPGIYQVNHLEENLTLDFLASPSSPRPVDDFDGDGKTDLAVYRPAEGIWYILESQTGNVRIVRFGLSEDIPVADDFDGDNRSDIAVYRPSNGIWYRLDSSNGQFHAIQFGLAEDKPVQADFDGDGKTDLAVFRPSTGVWHKLLSSDGSYQAAQFGIFSDIPVPADYDNDGKADLTVYRDGIWYQMNSSNNQVKIYQFGFAEDKPVRADFDGDGKPDTAVYRPSNGVWYWLESSDGDFQAKQFGTSTDIPTAADYNGDGRFEQAVFRQGTWFVSRNDNSFYATRFGQSGDIPVAGK